MTKSYNKHSSDRSTTANIRDLIKIITCLREMESANKQKIRNFTGISTRLKSAVKFLLDYDIIFINGNKKTANRWGSTEYYSLNPKFKRLPNENDENEKPNLL